MTLPPSNRPPLEYAPPLGDRPPAVTLYPTDVVIYGATSVGIAAAITARRYGLRVALLAFNQHVGGMTTGGLGQTDIGHKDAIGGLAREFYQRVGKAYRQDEAWQFEPSVASAVFREMLDEAGVEVFLHQRLAGVDQTDHRITALHTEDGSTFEGQTFIDAGYDGDLMAAAGVPYTVGREANTVYGETLNGIHFGHRNHNFNAPIDPYVEPGDPSSGLLWGISDEPHGVQGDGDHRVQAYNFRVCLTDRSDIKLPLPKPPGYDAKRYELLLRYLHAGHWDVLGLSKAMPNGKTDTNNYGAFSSDNIGRNHAWPDGDYATRNSIFQDHVTYHQGLYYFLANDSRVPEHVRADMSRWGLPADEFTDTGGWPPELYIREARRMVGDVVMTEHHCTQAQQIEDSVGLAAYQMDSHNCRRVVVDGAAINEGNVEVPSGAPYPISYRAIIPPRGSCRNLLVPWCLSASHIAFGSIRMEPVGMILGQSAATAAALLHAHGVAVQDLPYHELHDELVRQKQRLAWPISTPVGTCVSS